jgi:voltage-gated potassium channel
MLLQPHVAEFVDVVTPGTALEFRLAELPVGEESALADHTLAESHLRSRTGALVLALREPDGRFNPNPHPTTMLAAGQILIAIGTAGQLEALATLAG